MRKEDIKKLEKPYTDAKTATDRRFHAAIEADVPSAGVLVNEILNDLDTTTLGIRWWATLPDEERILISDYLYQCASGIETNLVEAKLHYLELLGIRPEQNKRIADAVSIRAGKFDMKIPARKSPLDELHDKLEGLHLSGFFRSVGSSLDCLGATIIGVLALPKSLRKSYISTAERTLKELVDKGTASQLELGFYDFYQQTKSAVGPDDWLKWATQYRNLLVHRGRQIWHHQLTPRNHGLLDHMGNEIVRTDQTTHLAKYPDKSDVESLITSKYIILDEDADTTLQGIFNSCRNLQEKVCERLVSIWQDRRNNPSYVEQPLSQWSELSKTTNFKGYKPSKKPLAFDLGAVGSALSKRFLAASVDDKRRKMWANSKWK